MKILRKINCERNNYLTGLYAQEDEVLNRVRGSAPVMRAHMQIDAYEGAILKLLVTMIGAQNVVEVGTFVGYSAIWLQRGMRPGGKVYSVENNVAHYNIACHNMRHFKYDQNIIVFNDDATSFLKNTEFDCVIDAIFIDGKKSEYCQYLDCAENILRPGGLVIADNTLLFDNVYHNPPEDRKGLEMWRAMRVFNERIADSSRFDAVMIPTDSGLTVAVKK